MAKRPPPRDMLTTDGRHFCRARFTLQSMPEMTPSQLPVPPHPSTLTCNCTTRKREMVITLYGGPRPAPTKEVAYGDDVDLLGNAVDMSSEDAGHVCAVTEAIGVYAVAHEVGAPLSAALEFHVGDQHATIIPIFGQFPQEAEVAF